MAAFGSFMFDWLQKVPTRNRPGDLKGAYEPSTIYYTGLHTVLYNKPDSTRGWALLCYHLLPPMGPNST